MSYFSVADRISISGHWFFFPSDTLPLAYFIPNSFLDDLFYCLLTLTLFSVLRRTLIKNITIAHKLILLISLSLLSLLLVSFGALRQMQSAQQRFDTVQTNVLPSIILLSDSSAYAAALRASVRDYIIGGFLNDQTLKND